jgi:mycobactin lysine-N-oxygenase
MPKVEPQTRLVIIGAGPKAMAIAAKARVLFDLKIGLPVPEVLIIEKGDVGANWKGGKNGFTDGTPSLRRSIERDIGYPYDTKVFIDHPRLPNIQDLVNEAMKAYSWQTYLVSLGQYTDWVDRGRRVANHSELQSYLSWVWKKVKSPRSRAPIRLLSGHAVTSISIDEGKWVISYQKEPSTSRTKINEVQADGVVFTGPGDITDPFTRELAHKDGYYNAQSFWPHWDDIRKAAKNAADRNQKMEFGIVGAGDAAASIVIKLSEHLGTDAYIMIFAPHGTVYSRGENYTETRFYSDPAFTKWTRLTKGHRRDFINRTDRAVFSQQAQQVLNSARNVEYQPGRVVSVKRANPVTSGRRLIVSSKYPPEGAGGVETFTFDYVIHAVSVKPLSMMISLLDIETLRRLPLCIDAEATRKLLRDARQNPNLGSMLEESGVLNWSAINPEALSRLLERNPILRASLSTVGIEGDVAPDIEALITLLNNNPALRELFETNNVMDTSVVNPAALIMLLKDDSVSQKPLKSNRSEDSGRTIKDYLEDLVEEALALSIERDLSVRDLSPKLHLPMLSNLQEGPGMPGLACLGLLSDRILYPYVSSAFPQDEE